MNTLTTILLFINTILLLYITVITKELLRKKRHEDYIEETKHEEAKDKAQIEIYGSLEGVLINNPSYVISKAIKKMGILKLSKEEISVWVNEFMSASTKKREEMFNNPLAFITRFNKDPKAGK